MIDDITPYWLGTARALREPEATRSIYPTSVCPFLSFSNSPGPLNDFSVPLKCQLRTAVKPAAVQKNTVKPAAIEINVRVYYNDYGNHRNNTEETRF